MPKPMQYKAGMLIYVEGASGNDIFILQSGSVALQSTDLETKEEVREMVKQGDFFGVKSALGNFPREETAAVTENCVLIVFSVEEFTQAILKNTRILTQLLKVYSKQLRKINEIVVKAEMKKTRRLDPSLQKSSGGSVNSPHSQEEGLYKLGSFYYEKRKYKESKYVLDQYVKTFPKGVHIQDVNDLLEILAGT